LIKSTQKKAEEVAVDWPGNRSNGQLISTKTKQQQQVKKQNMKQMVCRQKENKGSFFPSANEVALAHCI